LDIAFAKFPRRPTLAAPECSWASAAAHSCRESLGRSWGYEVKQLEGDYQQLALAYQARLLAKSAGPKIAKQARCLGEGGAAQAAGGTLDSPNRCVVRPAHAREVSHG